MTMHLEGPWLSTTGKKKTKRKFASAEHARKARELAEHWEQTKESWTKFKPFSDGKTRTTTKSFNGPVVTRPHVRDTGPRRPSRADTILGPVATKPNPCYTGTKILGIGTMHKSNAVPIFSSEEAEAISKMRR
jgi:hypothetical protein